MNALEFVKKEIDRMVWEIPSVRCRYEYAREAYTHFIEVIPSEVYKSLEQYHLMEENIRDKFEEQFPTETICFISSSSPYKIANPIYIKQGLSYTKDIVHDRISSLLQHTYSCRFWEVESFLSDSTTIYLRNSDQVCETNGYLVGCSHKPIVTLLGSYQTTLVDYDEIRPFLNSSSAIEGCYKISAFYTEALPPLIVPEVGPPTQPEIIIEEKALENPKPFLISCYEYTPASCFSV